jgi:uncharacterized BrkB/YihY/UPF0761 family membrane protein
VHVSASEPDTSAEPEAEPAEAAEAAPDGAGAAPPPEHHPSLRQSTRERIGMARHRVEDAYARLEASRETDGRVDTGFGVYERDRDRAGGLLAGALAYRLFIWLLPFALLVVSALGFLAAASTDPPEDLAEEMGTVGFVAQSIVDASEDAQRARWLTLLIALPALYWASLAAVKAMRTVHLLAWGLPIQPMRNKPKAAVVFLAWTALMLLALAVMSALRERAPGIGLIGTFGIVFVVAAGWLLASWLLPRAPDAPWTALIPGALLVGVGAQALHLFTVFYISRKISSASETYGALGAATALLLSLYLIGRLMVGSAMLNAELWERRRDAGART